MRLLLGVAFVIVTGVAAFTYRDVLLKPLNRGVVSKEWSVQRMVTNHSRLPTPVAASVAAITAIDSMASAYIMAIQDDGTDVRSMTELAFLYMKQGWFDQAIGPLARAREIDATSEPLRRYLELAVARAELGNVDLFQAARDFEERVAMEGQGC